MRRIIRLLLAAAALAMTTVTVTAPASAGADQPVTTTAFDQVASCFAERRHLVVLALVDESASLRSTDPTARRVDALVGMLRTLARYGAMAHSGSTGRIEVQLAGFGTGFSAGPWHELTPHTLAGLERAAAEFAGRDDTADTDFVLATGGAQAELVRRDAEVTGTGGRPPCRMLVLFTDGVYDLDSTGTDRPYASGVPRSDLPAIMDRGRRFLCDPGQLADQLRAAGTVIVAIGLVPDAPGRDAPPDQTFLRAVAERDAPGYRCGDGDTPPGRYVAANGLGGLLAAFDAAITQAMGGTPATDDPRVAVCAAAAPPDPRCERRFSLDASLREFHMLLNLGAPGIEAQLRPPRGAPARLRAGQEGTIELGAVSLSLDRLGDLDLVVDGRLPAGRPEWAGIWTVRFIDTTGHNAGAVARSQITVFGGLVPVTRPAPPVFQVGEWTEFDITVVDAAGSPRTPADFVRSATVSAILVDPRGGWTTVPVGPVRPDGGYGARYRVPDDASVSYVDLKVTLDVVTAGGLRLRPRTTTYRVPVRQPSAYPSVSPLELRLRPIIESGEATGSLTVTGGRGGAGCVWFGQVAFPRTPPESGELRTRFEPGATSERSCVRVGPGQSAEVTVAVEPARVRSGLADGQIVATLVADDEPPREVTIPVRFEMHRSANVIVETLLFVLMLLAGVLLPLLLLWLISWLAARFADPGQLRMAECPVLVTPDGVVEARSGWPVRSAIGVRHFAAMPPGTPSGRVRWFDCRELSFRRRISLLPWALPDAEVRAGGSVVLTCAGGRRNLTAARVSFALRETWVLVVDRSEPDTSGRLYLFLTDFDLATKAARVLEAVERELPARVRAVADRLHPDAEPDHSEQDETEDIYVPPPR